MKFFFQRTEDAFGIGTLSIFRHEDIRGRLGLFVRFLFWRLVLSCRCIIRKERDTLAAHRPISFLCRFHGIADQAV